MVLDLVFVVICGICVVLDWVFWSDFLGWMMEWDGVTKGNFLIWSKRVFVFFFFSVHSVSQIFRESFIDWCVGLIWFDLFGCRLEWIEGNKATLFFWIRSRKLRDFRLEGQKILVYSSFLGGTWIPFFNDSVWLSFWGFFSSTASRRFQSSFPIRDGSEGSYDLFAVVTANCFPLAFFFSNSSFRYLISPFQTSEPLRRRSARVSIRAQTGPISFLRNPIH